MSSWVETQPPPAIGRLEIEMMRPRTSTMLLNTLPSIDAPLGAGDVFVDVLEERAVRLADLEQVAQVQPG